MKTTLRLLLAVWLGLSSDVRSGPPAEQPRQPSSLDVASPRPAVTDVALTGDGVLRGLVRDTGGRRAADVVVEIGRPGLTVMRTRTDDTGRFQVSGLSGGVFVVRTAGCRRVLRVWTREAAPPAAGSHVELVLPIPVARGQSPEHGLSLDLDLDGKVDHVMAPLELVTVTAAVTGASILAVQVAQRDERRPASP